MVLILVLTHLVVAVAAFCLGGVFIVLLAKKLFAVVMDKEMAAKFGHELRARLRSDLQTSSVRHQQDVN